jgi:hypothetical protein
VRLTDGTDVKQLIARLQLWESELTLASNPDRDASRDLWLPFEKGTEDVGTDSEEERFLRDLDLVLCTPLSEWYLRKIAEIDSYLGGALKDPDAAGLFTERYWRMMDRIQHRLARHCPCR